MMQQDNGPLALPGLSAREVSVSRELHGENRWEAGKKSGFFKQFLGNFGDPIIKILLIALGLNVLLLFRHNDWYESAGIALAIFIATLVSTLSEYGSERAFEKMQQDAARIQCRVKREGRLILLPMQDIVVGDIILLQAGERVPADGVLLSGAVRVDQSSLNGESREVKKHPGPLPAQWDLSSPVQLFQGSVVTDGEAVLRAERVGMQTFYGVMAREMQEETRESPMRVRLTHLARTLSRFGYIAAVLVALADLFHAIVLANHMDTALIMALFDDPVAMAGHLLHAVTLAITVVVVAVPEGLPMMITIVLSANMKRMHKDHILVRKLVGIETSGSLNLLLCDKTGTLTRGMLEVNRFVCGDGREAQRFANLPKGLAPLLARQCMTNTASRPSGNRAIGGNATDRALMHWALPAGSAAEAVVSRIPFDSANKYSAVTLADGTVLVKGAPELILPKCRQYYDANARICPVDMPLIEQRWREMTAGGMRVLALASTKRQVSPQGPLPEMTLLGLACIRDDLRPEAAPSIRQAHNAGIQVIMITGDNQDTATAIARECGILGKLDKGVLTSAQMANLSDSHLKLLLPDLRVVARALPQDKSRLVRLAQECGLVVGMTGDGMNDAPALKKADVGFAMGSGAEVAKEAGDIVILDNNIASIAKAILYGRTIFKSIRKFIIFQLTMNFCAVGISVIGPFIGIDTPVTVLQMLWINIIMDTLAGIAFAGEPPLAETMRELPKRRSEKVLNREMMSQILFGSGFTLALCCAFLCWESFRSLFGYYSDELSYMTAFFTLFIFCGIFNSYNARTNRINLLAHIRRNPMFVIVMTLVTAVQILMVYWGGSLFRTTPLDTQQLVMILSLSFLIIPVDIIRKLIMRQRRKRR